MRPSLRGLMWLAAACALAGSVQAQDDSAQGSRYRNSLNRADAFRQSPKLITSNNAPRAPLGTYQSTSRGYFSTRIDQLRALRPDNKFNLIAPSRRLTMTSPIKRMLDRRNMLSARSPMGRMASSQLGRLDYVPDESGVAAGDISRIQASPEATDRVPATLGPDTGAFQKFLEDRLAVQADDYFQKGLDAFRRQNLVEAAQHFETVRLIERDRSRASLGLMFTRFQMGNLVQATIELLTAIERAEKAEDLVIQKEWLYEPAEFQRTMDAVTVWVRRTPDRAEANLTLAYFAWINGDLTTARNAMEQVDKKMPAYWNVASILRFREFVNKSPPSSRPAI